MTKKDLQKILKEFLLKSKSSLITEETLTQTQLDKRQDYLKDLMKQKSNLIKRYGKDAEAVMYGRATNLVKKSTSEMNKQKLKELVKKTLMQEDNNESSALFNDLEQKLKSHDWHYMMSDDNRAYTKGSAQQSEIRKLIKSLEAMGMGDEAKDLYNKYAPYKEGGPDFRIKEGKKEDIDKDGDIDSKDYLLKRDAAIQKAKGEMKEDMSKYKVGDKIKWSSPKGKVEDEIVGIDGIYIKLKSGGSIPYQSIVSEDMDLGHEDNEPHMLKGDLYRIGKYAMELYQMVDEFEGKDEVDFPAWWQAKITTAAYNMVSAKHYLDFETKEPSIDAALGVATSEEPMMEGIEFNINKYLAAHGKAPKGKGKWMFKVGNEEFSPSKSMSYADAKKEAAKKAKEKNVTTITVLSESHINEDEISAEEKLAVKIAKALKAVGNKDSSDQSNLKQARSALNKGNIDAAKKIADPYLEEKKLTKAEKNKKEDIVKGMKGNFKGDKDAMYAIATSKAKKVAENLTKQIKND